MNLPTAFRLASILWVGIIEYSATASAQTAAAPKSQIQIDLDEMRQQARIVLVPIDKNK